MFKLFKYFKKSDWLFTALLIVIVALQVNLDLMLPDLMGDIVGFIQYNALYEEPLREILRTGGLMLLVVAGGFVCKLHHQQACSHPPLENFQKRKFVQHGGNGKVQHRESDYPYHKRRHANTADNDDAVEIRHYRACHGNFGGRARRQQQSGAVAGYRRWWRCC